MSAFILGGAMFGRKRKKEADGQICPLCQLLNAEEAESCTRCYYEFTVAAHRQTVSEITDEESGGLFDALLEEDEEADADTPLVDWTSHSFSMDDMTVEAVLVDILRWSVEAGSTAHNALHVTLLAFLPDKY